LQSDEELQAAVERARAFERRHADDHQRRVGAYDRFLSQGGVQLASVVPMGLSVANSEQECNVDNGSDAAQAPTFREAGI
jgi:hypothetical protein